MLVTLAEAGALQLSFVDINFGEVFLSGGPH